MATKDSILHIRIKGDQKERIAAEAEKQGVNVPEYVLGALEFYSGLDVSFLKHIRNEAEKVKLPMSTVIQQLLVAYLAADVANIEDFKAGGKTYHRAFQYDETGLIEGDKHSQLVYKQQKKENSVLRQKLENAVKAGEPVMITWQDAANIAAAYSMEKIDGRII